MYKCWFLGVGENRYATNGLEFDTIQEADDYGENKLFHWTGAEDFKILPLEFDGVDTSIANISNLAVGG